MGVVSPPSSRSFVSELSGVLTVVVPARVYGLFLFFSCIWLVFWPVPLFLMVQSILRHEPKNYNAFGFLWLCGWAVGGLGIMFSVVRMVVGTEVITLDGTSLMIRQKVGPLKWGQTYDVGSVSRLRVAPVESNRLQWQGFRSYGTAPGPIAFDYGSRTIRFGAGLDEAEAFVIVKQLSSRLPSSAVSFTP